MVNSNNIIASHRFPQASCRQIYICVLRRTNIRSLKSEYGCCANARTLHLTVPKQRGEKKKKDFTHILLGAKYFIQSQGDSCHLANRTMTVLWRHMQV